MNPNSLIKKLTLIFIATASAVSTLSAQAISANTKLSITIKGVPVEEQGQINGEYVVTNTGLIRLPYLEQGVRAAGITSAQLALRIEAAYQAAEIYDNPRITVISNKDEEAQ